jgi:hypothetical protein
MLVDGIHAVGGQDAQHAHAIKFSRRRMMLACIVGPRRSFRLCCDFAATLLVSPLFPFASFRAHDFD